MWSGTIVLFSALAITLASQAISPLEPKPDRFQNQEGCYMSEFDKVVPLGQSIPSTKDCAEYVCRQDNVLINGCSAVAVQPSEELVEEKDKPYPDCCPKIKSTNC